MSMSQKSQNVSFLLLIMISQFSASNLAQQEMLESATLAAASPQRGISAAPIASPPERGIAAAPYAMPPVGDTGVAPIVSPPEGGTESTSESCITGNPIDDCWRCGGSPWPHNRKRLVHCANGLYIPAIGGKEGDYYVVMDDSDQDKPGTLRYAVTRDVPLWITFDRDMVIHLRGDLDVKSFKTIDGRGAEIHITGYGCITVKNAAHVIVHGIHVHGCKDGGRGSGDGVSILGARNVWVDHCSLSNCEDGLIDVTHNSTGIAITNNLFTHHDKVMLLGRADDDTQEKNMKVIVAYNHFGEGLRQRMPRCRHGYFHVVNNYYSSGWGLYAIGGSAEPTIFSQSNIFSAPKNPSHKEVTSRICNGKEWRQWNWKSEGDVFVNGAFFVPSGTIGLSSFKQKWHMKAKPASMVPSITRNAGVLKL